MVNIYNSSIHTNTSNLQSWSFCQGGPSARPSLQLFPRLSSDASALNPSHQYLANIPVQHPSSPHTRPAHICALVRDRPLQPCRSHRNNFPQSSHRVILRLWFPSRVKNTASKPGLLVLSKHLRGTPRMTISPWPGTSGSRTMSLINFWMTCSDSSHRKEKLSSAL